jgi:hypothetical protein
MARVAAVLIVVVALAVAAFARLGVTGDPMVAAITATLTPTNTPGPPSYPNLVITSVSIDFENFGACNWQGTDFGVHARVRNVGPITAGTFVVEINGAPQYVTGLSAGADVLLFSPGYVYLGTNTVIVDSTSLVTESNESDNLFSGPIAVPTAPPTCTATATHTPTPTPTITPTPTATEYPCLSGPDCDGFTDATPPPTRHYGPANSVHLYDNCIGVTNFGQENSDGDFIQLKPLAANDDVTQPNSDAVGDACDEDDDNDGITDTVEISGAACAGTATNPLERDSDFDRRIDSAECALGTDPMSAASLPSVTACRDAVGGIGMNVDADGVLDDVEYCYYGTPRLSADDDGDGCSDGKEIASQNQGRDVNVLDLLIVAQNIPPSGAYAAPGTAVQRNADTNKNGRIDILDLGFVASFATGGACP